MRLKKGIVNLEKHIENLQKFGVPVVVTLNSFLTDTEAEYEFMYSSSVKKEAVSSHCPRSGHKGGEGGIALAEKVLKTLEEKGKSFCSAVSDE